MDLVLRDQCPTNLLNAIQKYFVVASCIDGPLKFCGLVFLVENKRIFIDKEFIYCEKQIKNSAEMMRLCKGLSWSKTCFTQLWFFAAIIYWKCASSMDM